MDRIAEKNGTRRHRKKVETRRQIIDTAMEMFREKGIRSTSMEQIANRVDISKMTIYNYFPVKEAIISAFLQTATRNRKEEEIAGIIAGSPDTRSRLMDLYRRSFEWVKENRELYQAYLGYRMKNLFVSIEDPGTRSGFEDLLCIIISAGQEAGEIRRDMAAELLARHLEMIGIAALKPWWIDPDSFSLEENLGPVFDLFLDGCTAKL